MSMNLFCPKCGIRTEPGLRNCANCGAMLNVTTANPMSTEFKPGSSAPDLAGFKQETGSTHISGSPESLPEVFQSSTITNYQYPQTPYQVVPDFARPPKDPKRKRGRKLLLLSSIACVILVIFGSIFLVFRIKENISAEQVISEKISATKTAKATKSTPTSGNQIVPKWVFPTKAKVVSSPTVVDGVVYVGSEDNKVYAIDATSGQKKWIFPTKVALWILRRR